MADFDVPADLLELERDFLQLDDRCGKISAALPSPLAVLEGKADPDPEGQADLLEARSERLRIVEQIHRHPWWGGVSNRYDASMALRRLAIRR
ncbi:hypothetical protein GCM10010412_028520 [Nonomuraea recticatena]|uniref:Uncharacterized protein n=1 Tax=Nonomuraea recticatena TaxID=46178 RepID=A0ABN3RPX4_9ACTN